MSEDWSKHTIGEITKSEIIDYLGKKNRDRIEKIIELIVKIVYKEGVLDGRLNTNREKDAVKETVKFIKRNL